MPASWRCEVAALARIDVRKVVKVTARLGERGARLWEIAGGRVRAAQAAIACSQAGEHVEANGNRARDHSPSPSKQDRPERRPLDGNRLRECHSGSPRLAERGRVGPLPQPLHRPHAHPHRPRGGRSGETLSQRPDEPPLPGNGPPVTSGADGHGGEAVVKGCGVEAGHGGKIAYLVRFVKVLLSVRGSHLTWMTLDSTEALWCGRRLPWNR